MNVSKWITGIVLTLVTLTSLGNAAPITVLPVAGDSVHPQIRSAAREVLVIYLHDHKMDVRENDAKEAVASRAAADEVAKKAGVGHYIDTRITRLGKRVIIQVNRFAVGTTSPEYSDRMTAATPSDLETVMQRLALSLATGKRAAQNESIETVTQREQKNLRRREANSYFGVTIGGVQAFGHDLDFIPGLGFGWLWDNRNALLGVELKFNNASDHASYTEVALSGYYPFSDGDTTAFVGGGLGYSNFSIEDNQTDEFDQESYDREDTSGLNLNFGAGFLIGRTSTVSIRPEIGYFVGLYDVDDKHVHGMRLGVTLGF
jgi:hypothetical protein